MIPEEKQLQAESGTTNRSAHRTTRHEIFQVDKMACHTQCSTIQYSALQYITAQCITSQYSTEQCKRTHLELRFHLLVVLFSQVTGAVLWGIVAEEVARVEVVIVHKVCLEKYPEEG